MPNTPSDEPTRFEDSEENFQPKTLEEREEAFRLAAELMRELEMERDSSPTDPSAGGTKS